MERKSEANIFRSSSCINYCCVMFTAELLNFKIIFGVCFCPKLHLKSIDNWHKRVLSLSLSMSFSKLRLLSWRKTEASKLWGIKDVVAKHPFVKFEIFCHWSVNEKHFKSQNQFHFVILKLFLNEDVTHTLKCTLLSHTEKSVNHKWNRPMVDVTVFHPKDLPLAFEGYKWKPKTPSDDNILWNIIETSVVLSTDVIDIEKYDHHRPSAYPSPMTY